MTITAIPNTQNRQISTYRFLEIRRQIVCVVLKVRNSIFKYKHVASLEFLKISN